MAIDLLRRGAVALLLSCTLAAAQGAWKLMHDPLHVVPFPQATAAEQALITKAGRIAGFKGSDREENKGQMLLEARMPGPFLVKGAQETALLYGDGNQELGLIVLRAGKPVLHLQLMGHKGVAAMNEGYALKDVDGDGLRELAVVQSYADGGQSSWLNYLNFAGVAGGGLPKLSAAFRTAQVNCDVVLVNGREEVPCQERRYRLWVRPGPLPHFRADELGRSSLASKPPPPPLKLLRQGIQPPLIPETLKDWQLRRLALP